MKTSKRKTILVVIIFLIVLIFFFFYNKNPSIEGFQEDILFVKKIHFEDTIHKNTLISEKIAPGTSGNFEIVLESNQKTNYQIKFKSKNEKPQNLIFQIEGKGKKYQSLEEMEKDLKGRIGENKSIQIHWKWEYEIGEKENQEDTEDGQKLKKYEFEIYGLKNK